MSTIARRSLQSHYQGLPLNLPAQFQLANAAPILKLLHGARCLRPSATKCSKSRRLLFSQGVLSDVEMTLKQFLRLASEIKLADLTGERYAANKSNQQGRQS